MIIYLVSYKIHREYFATEEDESEKVLGIFTILDKANTFMEEQANKLMKIRNIQEKSYLKFLNNGYGISMTASHLDYTGYHLIFVAPYNSNQIIREIDE